MESNPGVLFCFVLFLSLRSMIKLLHCIPNINFQLKVQDSSVNIRLLSLTKPLTNIWSSLASAFLLLEGRRESELSLAVFCLDLFPPYVLREDLFLNHWWSWLSSEHPQISCLLHSRAVFISTFSSIQLLMWVLRKQAQESVFVKNAHCQLCYLQQLRVNQHLREKYLLSENSVKCLFPFILNNL